MNTKHYIGKKAKSITIGTKLPPITGIELNGSNDATFIAGDKSGHVLKIYVPTATQQMANEMLVKTKGFEYQGYDADNAYLSPEAELGDGITIDGHYGMLVKREFSFTPKLTATISAPYETEEDSEYQYKGSYSRDLANKIQLGSLYFGTKITRQNGLEIIKTDGDIQKSRVRLNSDILAFYNDDGQEAFYYDASAGVFRITQYANVEDALEHSKAFTQLNLSIEKFQLTIGDIEGNIADIQITANKLSSQISDINGNIADIQITANKLNSQIGDIEGNISHLQQTASSLTTTVSNLNMSVSSIEQKIDSIALNVTGSLGSTAYIKLSVGGEEVTNQEIELSNVRSAFANDSSAIEIGAGTITFDAGTFILKSNNVNIDATGVLSTSDGSGTTTISGGYMTTAQREKKIKIGNGVNKYYYYDTLIGNLGNNQIVDSLSNGIVFDLDYTGEFMAWAAKTSNEEDSYVLKILYANKPIYTPQGRIFEGDAFTIACNTFLEGQLYFGLHSNDYTARMYRGTTTSGLPDFGIRSKEHMFLITEKDLYLQPKGDAIVKTGTDFRVESGTDVRLLTTGPVTNSYITLYGDGDTLIRSANDLRLSSVYGDVYINSQIVSIDSLALNLGTTPLVSDSDLRLKTNIQEVSIDALSILNNIRLYSFDWALNGAHKNLGFISQQIDAEASSDFIQYDEKDDTYRIKETSFIPYLVRAVQQLYSMLVPIKPVQAMEAYSTPWTPNQYTETEKQLYLKRILKSREQEQLRQTSEIPKEELQEDSTSTEIQPILVQ